MINEELLGFIRAQRIGGMGDDELTQLLLTEGGWAQTDIDEAYRALATPVVPVSAVSEQILRQPITPNPTEHKEEVSGVVSPAASLPASPSSPSTPISETPPPAPFFTTPTPTIRPPAPVIASQALNIEQFLPDTPSDRPLVQQKISHDEFLGLFSDKGKQVSEVSPLPAQANKEDAVGVQIRADSLAVVPPRIIEKTNPPPLVTKKQEWSIEELLTESKGAPSVAPVAPAPKAKEPLSPTSTAASVKPPQIKFDLSSALGQSGFSFATPPLPTIAKTGVLPHLGTGIPSEPPVGQLGKSTISPLAPPNIEHLGTAVASARPPVPIQERVSEAVVAPSHEDKAKTKFEISGKRTMTSDLLRGASVPNAPAPVLPAQEKAPPPEVHKEKATPQATPNAPSTAPLFPDELTRQKKIKRSLLILVGTLFVAALIGAGVFALIRFRAPDPEVLLSAAFTQFFQTPSFAYKGEAMTDVTLSSLPGHPGRDGKIKFVLEYSGTLASGTEGYGDGTHKISFDGGWQSGTSTFGTNIDSDVLIIGNDFYFNVLSIPKESDLDAQLLHANWVKVNFADIARELQLSGITQGEEEYGSFGGTTGETSLRTTLQKVLPFKTTGSVLKEDLDGVAAIRTHVLADPDRFLDLLRALYRRYWNRDLTFSDEETLRFKGALTKLEGDVWTNRETGALMQVALTGNFDDDIGGVHVKGPIAIKFSLSDFGKPALFGTPSPVLSLPELQVQLEESKKLKEANAKDEVRISRMTLLVQALQLYQSEKGRYPKELTELYAAKKITSASIDLSELKDYVYRSYLTAENPTKGGACLTSGKICAFYHLGTSLLSPENLALQSDADRKTAILGADSAGCSGEAHLSCYDVVSPPLVKSTSGTSTAPSLPAKSSSTGSGQTAPATGSSAPASGTALPAPASQAPAIPPPAPAPASGGTVSPPPPPAH